MWTLLALMTGMVGATTPDCPCESEYRAFAATYDRPTSPARCRNFCTNLALVNDHNARPDTTYTAAIKPFHDLSELARLVSLYNGYYSNAPGLVPPPDAPPPLTVGWAGSHPESRDWWAQGRVVDVRNQGRCGDCWAESAIAVLESAYAQQTGTLVELSVEQVAECTPQERNRGCEGGWPVDALRWAKVNGGVCTEADYPTTIGTGIDSSCNATVNCTKAITIGEVVQIPTGDEDQMFAALTTDVVSVAIDASGRGFSAYASGVYDGTFNGTVDCNKGALDHAVLVAGYGTLDATGVPFYAVKNSWGTAGWGGMGGYLLMRRGINVCGIAQDAVHITF